MGDWKAADVGKILVKVREDLKSLKNKVLDRNHKDSDIDISALENAIHSTDNSIKEHTEFVLQQLNNHVLILPNLSSSAGIVEDRDSGVALKPTPPKPPATQPSGLKKTISEKFMVESRRDILLPRRNGPNKEPVSLNGPSPAQQMKQLQNEKATHNVFDPLHREVMHSQFGIQLPLIAEKKHSKMDLQPIKGPTVDSLTTLPKSNRLNPQLQPPSISEMDAQKGILSLCQRGLIPATADIVLDPPPVNLNSAKLHDSNKRQADKNKHSTFSESTYCLQIMPTPKPDANSPLLSDGRPVSKENLNQRLNDDKERSLIPFKTFEIATDQPFPPPTTPASALESRDKTHRFAIQHGNTRQSSQEFIAFKQHYCLAWGSIVTMLTILEKLLTKYSVPIAFICGEKLADLAMEYEMELVPSQCDLLSVVVNREDVENIIRRPGRRFMASNGQNIAATIIQAAFKRYHERVNYLAYRKQKWAAGVIALAWLMYIKLRQVRINLRKQRANQLAAYHRRSLEFSRNWSTISKSRKVIIHMPSLGFSAKIRNKMVGIAIKQNCQMSRLCDISDPNVDVVYISPVSINEEMIQYYTKLLGLKSAIDTGNVEDQMDVSDRYRIITPDAVNSFPNHHMCLSTILKYSPKTLKRIRNLIRGREAYIITQVPHADDLYISDYLDVPLYATEPDKAAVYSCKSGAKRVFRDAGVDVPPGVFDVYNMAQLHENLAQLITQNLSVTRWLFKLDDERNGRGIAYCDIADTLPSYQWTLKEAARYGDKWCKKWAQEAAYIKIFSEISDVLENHGKPCDTQTFPTWQSYIDTFLRQGGIIEASPPSDSITAITANMVIEPDGNVKIIMVGDQIHNDTPYSSWGMSVPQCSIDPATLNKNCLKVGESCRALNALGHFSVDFVTFINPTTLVQELWATDLKLNYGDGSAITLLLSFVTRGTLDFGDHTFNVSTPLVKADEGKRIRRRRACEEDKPAHTKRYAVFSTRLFHTNLSVVHYSVFFQMCRAHGIGYDIKEKQGTVFILMDSFTRECLTMLSIGDNLQSVLSVFSTNLSVIHQEISAPNMQGNSNFKEIIDEIESILGRAQENLDEA